MKRTQSLEDKNEVLQRVIAFMNLRGGIAPVARRIGKNEQTFRSMISRNTKPSVDLLQDFANEFHDFDVNYIVTGKVIGDDVIAKLRAELERERVISEALAKGLSGKPEATTKSLLVDDEEEAARASEMFTTPPVQLGVILPIYMEYLVEKYGITFNPSLD